jgi:hypothetical protein
MPLDDTHAGGVQTPPRPSSPRQSLDLIVAPPPIIITSPGHQPSSSPGGMPAMSPHRLPSHGGDHRETVLEVVLHDPSTQRVVIWNPEQRLAQVRASPARAAPPSARPAPRRRQPTQKTAVRRCNTRSRRRRRARTATRRSPCASRPARSSTRPSAPNATSVCPVPFPCHTRGETPPLTRPRAAPRARPPRSAAAICVRDPGAGAGAGGGARRTRQRTRQRRLPLPASAPGPPADRGWRGARRRRVRAALCQPPHPGLPRAYGVRKRD